MRSLEYALVTAVTTLITIMVLQHFFPQIISHLWLYVQQILNALGGAW